MGKIVDKEMRVQLMEQMANRSALELLDNYISTHESVVREVKRYRAELVLMLNGEGLGTSNPEDVLGWATNALKNAPANCRTDLLGKCCVELAQLRAARDELALEAAR